MYSTLSLRILRQDEYELFARNLTKINMPPKWLWYTMLNKNFSGGSIYSCYPCNSWPQSLVGAVVIPARPL